MIDPIIILCLITGNWSIYLRISIRRPVICELIFGVLRATSRSVSNSKKIYIWLWLWSKLFVSFPKLRNTCACRWPWKPANWLSMRLVCVILWVVSTTFVSVVNGVMLFENIHCHSSNKTASSNYSCYINQKGTKNENVNFEATTKNAIGNAMVLKIWLSDLVQLSLLFDHWQVYFEVSYRKNLKDPHIVLVKISDQEICKVLSKMDHPALRWFLQKVGESLERQIHPCPYQVSEKLKVDGQTFVFLSQPLQGHIQFLNITIRQIGGFSPAGLYKVYIKFMNNDDDNLFEITINLKIIYPRKGKKWEVENV